MTKAKSARVLQISPDAQLDKCATEITHALQKTVEGIFETGRLLLRSHEKLEHGQWMRLFNEHRVPISLRTADRFIQIWKARARLLPNSSHVTSLPPLYGTVAALAALPEDTLAWAYEQGRITPNLQRADVKRLRTAFAPAGESDEVRESFHADVSTAKVVKAIRGIAATWPTSESLEPLIQRLRSEADRLEQRQKGRAS